MFDVSKALGIRACALAVDGQGIASRCSRGMIAAHARDLAQVIESAWSDLEQRLQHIQLSALRVAILVGIPALEWTGSLS